MLLLQELIEKLRTSSWSVDCVEMQLTPGSDARSGTHAGPGYFRQEADGTIAYKVYPPPPASFDPRSISSRPGVAGRILGAERFHRLEARDKTGIVWQAARTLPIPESCLLGGKPFEIVSGTAYELTFTRSFVKQEIHCLTLVFFTDERVPGNASTEVATLRPDGSSSKKTTLDTAVFSTVFGDFSIYNNSGALVVEVVSKNEFPPHFETRIVEALGLVLAKPLAWNVIERYENATEIVRVRGRREVIDAKLPPPIATGKIDFSGGGIWLLFDKYLAMICSKTEEDFHCCSRHLFAVLEASAGVISARGLALGVAAEGIAKELHPLAGAPMEGIAEVIQPLTDHCLDWAGMPKGELGESLRRRLPGMIGQLNNVSTKDKLRALVDDKVIYPAHIRAWSDLRNTLAHGVAAGGEDIQELVDLCDRVTVLMYHLIFRAVGYEGNYKDYSVHGWPKKYYRGRPVTQEEIAIAAYYIWKNSGEPDGRDVAHWLQGREDLEKGLY